MAIRGYQNHAITILRTATISDVRTLWGRNPEPGDFDLLKPPITLFVVDDGGTQLLYHRDWPISDRAGAAGTLELAAALMTARQTGRTTQRQTDEDNLVPALFLKFTTSAAIFAWMIRPQAGLAMVPALELRTGNVSGVAAAVMAAVAQAAKQGQ